MKKVLKTIIVSISLLTIGSVVSAQVSGESLAAGATSPSPSSPADKKSNPVIEKTAVRDPIIIGAAKVGDLIGMDVVNRQGEKLGSVKEFAVDIESGRVVQVILATGGFLGIGAAETAVPPGALVLDLGMEVLQLDAGRDRLLGAPPFDDSKWSEAFTTERLAAVYEHFGRGSSFDFVDGADQTGRLFTILESKLDGIQRASEIAGMKVVNLESEPVGDVAEIIIDLSTGRIIALVVASGKFLGIEGELSAIPATAFRISTDRERLQFDTNRAALEAAPHFKGDRWPDFTQEGILEAVFAAYSVEPYFRSDIAPNPSGITLDARSEGAPVTQGGSLSDQATTAAIQKEIRSLVKASNNARNVSVVTLQGRTTLSGPVDTAEEKRIIGEIASRNNRLAEVENLLVVKTQTTAPE